MRQGKRNIRYGFFCFPVFYNIGKFFLSYIIKRSAGCARCAKEGYLQQPHIGAAKRSKVCISFRSVLSGHLQDVQHPSRIEEYREFKADLSALFFSRIRLREVNAVSVAEKYPDMATKATRATSIAILVLSITDGSTPLSSKNFCVPYRSRDQISNTLYHSHS